jgi:hypothetical protein
MEVKFVIDENYLIYHTLCSMGSDSFSNEKYKKDIIKFQTLAWKISQNNYNLLIGRMTPDQLDDKYIKKQVSQLPSFLKELKISSEFKNILQQTENYLKSCQKQWNKNIGKTSKYIHAITGLVLDKKFTIYISHPSLKNGRYIGKNKIIWGHNEDWKNYTTIYLWHEILHSYFDYSDISHVLIELITDEELRAFLNKEIYPPFIGHSHLQEIKNKILPKWKKYLNSDKKDIKDFYIFLSLKLPHQYE